MIKPWDSVSILHHLQSSNILHWINVGEIGLPFSCLEAVGRSAGGYLDTRGMADMRQATQAHPLVKVDPERFMLLRQVHKTFIS